MSLFSELSNINELITLDFGGGSPISKTYIMAYLILRNNLKTYVEIGVYRGKSLFPATYAIKQNKGMSYGIDPYLKETAREYDIEENLQMELDEFIDKLDFENVYQDVIRLRSRLSFENHLKLIRKKSSDSVEFFKKNNIKIDMLHIDGNHDTKYVMEDVELYLPLLKPDSVIVMDDIDWDSVKPAYEKLKETTTVIFESNDFAILINNKIGDKIFKSYELELKSIFDLIQTVMEQKSLIKENTNIITNLKFKLTKIYFIQDLKANLTNNINKLKRFKDLHKRLNYKFITLLNLKFVIPLKMIGGDDLQHFQDIIILDDIFPHPLSAFRLQEYNSYLEYFDKVKIYSNARGFPVIQEKQSLKTIIENYERENPQFKFKVEEFRIERILHSNTIYTIFLNNAYYYIDIIEKYRIPFVFTLYPGGGFLLKNKLSDKKLKRVFSSPYFRKVIVTQRITYDYLVNNNFCKPEQIEEIFGVVTPLDFLDQSYDNKIYFGRDKSDLDICFVAYRYTEKGVDKGYDIFIEVAHELAKKYDNIHFHVVGSFDETILDVTQIKDKISFYGTKMSEWFDEFYRDKDIILSPNIHFKLFDGSFDGFPTGCCTDAGLHKVAIFCTDELNMNRQYKDKEEIVIIPHDAQKIVKLIEKYYRDPEKLEKIADAGYLKSKKLYNYENQIAPRIKILEELIK